MARKPVPGSDGNNWGTILNDHLDDLAAQVAAKANTATVTPLVTAQRGIYHIDNYASVQAALTAAGNAGGGTVTGDKATAYAVTDLIIPANVTLSGITLTISGTATTDANAIRLDGDSATIADCSITISGANYGRVIYHAANKTKSIRNILRTSALTRVYPNRFRLISYAGTITGVVIDGNDLSYTAQAIYGIGGNDAPGVRIQNNWIHDVSTNGWLAAGGDMPWAIYPGSNCYGNVVTGNRIENVEGGGIHQSNLGVGASLDYGRVTANNTIVNAAYYGIGIETCNAATITGNTVRGAESLLTFTSDNLGGSVTGNTFANMQIVNDAVPRSVQKEMISLASPGVTFTGNDVAERGDAALGILVTGAGCVVSDNVFRDPPSGAILTTGARSSITNNIINATASTAVTSVVYVQAADAVVSGNIIETPKGIGNFFGVRTSGAAANAQVRGNRINGERGVWQQGANNTIADNDLTGCTVPLATTAATGTLLHHAGTAAPTLAVAIGSTWRRTDGAAGTTFYINETGTTTWRAV